MPKRRASERAPTRMQDAGLLSSVIAASPTGMLMVDAAGRIVLANQRLEQIVGYAAGELVGRPLDDLLPERSRPAHAHHSERFHADPQPRHMGRGRDLYARHKDGHEIPVEIGLAPLRHEGMDYVLASVVDIRERKRAEERLQWLSLAVEQGPTSVIMTDLQGKIEYVNPRFCDVTGYTFDEVRSKTPRLLQSGQTPPEVYREMWATIVAGGSWHGEIMNRKKDGTLYWDAMWVYPIRDPQGKVTRFLALKEDISERKQAEQEIRERDERLRQLAENIREVFFVMDAQDREILYISPAYEEIWGRTCQSLYEKPRSFLEPVVPEDLERIVKNMARIQLGEDAEEVEFRVIRPNGQVRWVLLHAVPVRNEQNAVYRIVGVALDITRRKEAEAAVVASERRLRTLFETVNLIVLGLDAEGKVEYVNPFFLNLTGYTHDEVLGKSWFEFLPKAQRMEMTDVFRELVQGDSHAHYENAIVTKAGEERMIAWNNTVPRDAHGRPTGTLSIGEDVTERQRLERQLRQAQKMEAIGRLAGGVAHDFNNVLSAIFGYVDLLREGFAEESQTQQDLGEIRKAAERASGLTRQLLAFSRQQVLEPVVLNLNDLVEDFEKMLRRVIGEDIDLRLAPARDLGNVRADPGQVQQVLMNLVVNARDAMPTGGTLTIETANAELTEQYAELHQPVTPGSYIMLAVSDTGIGMDQELQARIFEPFFTTKEKGKGTGLGLSTVYGIVKQSSGYVWVYSERSRGTTFKVYLPRVDAPARAPAPPREAKRLTGTETVLLAEDDDMLRPLAKELLAKLGYTVLEAANADQALELARKYDGPIQLLLSDVVMPGPSGRELARRLAVTRPDTKVLYVSGYTDDAIVHHGMLEAGLNFLQKPFTPQTLARKVRDVLDTT
jgi:two-component system, cell cycle sensor histidine kinase and response regulator CckA